ncbi:hypothetical protein HAX54_016810 [Datura stramonium]|uniref:Uncharacterized protein n=1 Tax=Datura stramonium TaxID=4076 RepID=A0ABS8UJS7_DATST|nr:hypothetical protein [Datura stramonium]
MADNISGMAHTFGGSLVPGVQNGTQPTQGSRAGIQASPDHNHPLYFVSLRYDTEAVSNLAEPVIDTNQIDIAQPQRRWLEPYAPDFQNDDEADDNFVVLVPCYRHECKEIKEANNQFLSVIENLSKVDE